MSRDPEAVTICCSFVPANWPKIACVMDAGGWIVREYMNMLEVAVILPCRPEYGTALNHLFDATVAHEFAVLLCRATSTIVKRGHAKRIEVEFFYASVPRRVNSGYLILSRSVYEFLLYSMYYIYHLLQ